MKETKVWVIKTYDRISLWSGIDPAASFPSHKMNVTCFFCLTMNTMKRNTKNPKFMPILWIYEFHVCSQILLFFSIFTNLATIRVHPKWQRLELWTYLLSRRPEIWVEWWDWLPSLSKEIASKCTISSIRRPKRTSHHAPYTYKIERFEGEVYLPQGVQAPLPRHLPQLGPPDTCPKTYPDTSIGCFLRIIFNKKRKKWAERNRPNLLQVYSKSNTNVVCGSLRRSNPTDYELGPWLEGKQDSLA